MVYPSKYFLITVSSVLTSLASMMRVATIEKGAFKLQTIIICVEGDITRYCGEIQVATFLNIQNDGDSNSWVLPLTCSCDKLI